MLTVSSDESCSPLPGTGMGDPFTKGSLCPAFRLKGGGQRVPPAAAFSQLPSTQNNPYAKVAYIGVACSDSLD